MDMHELSTKLNDMYFNSKDGEAVVMIHLFAITYAEDIKASGASMEAIAIASGIPKSYGTEISKGVKLAQFVTPR